MPILRTKTGLERVFVDNFTELSVEVDGLEALAVTGNTNTANLNTNMTNGNQVSQLFGRTDVTDDTTKKALKCDADGKLEVSGGGTPAISGFGLETTQSTIASRVSTTNSSLAAISAKLPSPLQDGNLKVQIMAGGTPAITGFSTETTMSAMSGKLPTALSGSGNLKVSIEEGAIPAITGFSTETTMSAMNAKISKGEATSVTAGTGGLQQTLLYGRHSNGDLRALECLGNRLITTDLVFGATGPNEPTALARIAIHGQVNATNTYKNLRVSTDGVLSTDKVLKSSEAQTNTSMTIAVNSVSSLEINTTGYSKVRISGVSSTTDPLLLMGSTTSGGVLMAFDTIMPVSNVYDSTGGIQMTFSKLIECPPTFIKIRNPMGYTIDIIASNIKMIV